MHKDESPYKIGWIVDSLTLVEDNKLKNKLCHHCSDPPWRDNLSQKSDAFDDCML